MADKTNTSKTVAADTVVSAPADPDDLRAASLDGADGKDFGDEVIEDPYAVRVVDIPTNKWLRRYRSVAFQMVIMAILAFSGPSMSNAISGLGGGGLATPWTANTALAVQYSTAVLVTMLGGPIISAIGIPVSCLIGAIGFPLSGSGFYVNSKYGVQWYLIFAKAIYGITSSFLYIAEAASMISYPEEHRRGFYIGIWVCMRSLGSIIGSAISFGLNHKNSGSGGVSTNTYLVFLGMECIGLPAAFLLTKSRKVIRYDGWGVPMLPKKSWKVEMKLLWEHHKQKRTLLLIPIYILTYFGDGVWSTYASLHYSVRARTLAHLIGPLMAVGMNPLFGMLLDTKRLGPRAKGILGFWVFSIPSTVMLIMVMINLSWFDKLPDSLRLDYAQPTTARWVRAFFPHLIYSIFCWMSQTLVYWLLGQFASDVSTNARTGGVFRCWETTGQAISYGINAHTTNKFVPFGIYVGLFAIAMPLFYSVILELPKESHIVRVVDDDGHQVAVLEPTAPSANTTAVERP